MSVFLIRNEARLVPSTPWDISGSCKDIFFPRGWIGSWFFLCLVFPCWGWIWLSWAWARCEMWMFSTPLQRGQLLPDPLPAPPSPPGHWDWCQGLTHFSEGSSRKMKIGIKIAWRKTSSRKMWLEAFKEYFLENYTQALSSPHQQFD